MADKNDYYLYIEVLNQTPTVILDGITLLFDTEQTGELHRESHVVKLFKKLVKSHDTILDYAQLEKELFDSESVQGQGAEKTKNAVIKLREILIRDYSRNGEQKWEDPIKKGEKVLLVLKKPQKSQILLSLPLPPGDPDIYVDVLARERFKTTAKGAIVLPPLVSSRHFFGRDTLLETIHAKFASMRSRCLALRGTGGLGKTHIALEYARQYQKEYPGGVFWVNAKDTQSIQEQYADISLLFGVPADLSAEDRAKRMRETLQQIPDACLLILDDITSKSSLQQWLPAIGPCRILITTRSKHLLMTQFEDIAIPRLNDEQGVNALQAACTINTTAERLAAREPGCSFEEAYRREETAVKGINADVIERLPLTLMLIAYYVAQRQTTFEDCRRKLNESSYSVIARTDVGYSVEDAFKITHTDLSASALKVLSTASCFAGRGISPVLLCEAAGLPNMDFFEEAVTSLDGGSFITREVNGRITLHELIRDMTYSQIQRLERPSIIERTAGTLKKHLKAANEAMHWDTVRPDIAHYRAVAEHCKSEHLYLPLAHLLYEIGTYYYFHDETEQSLHYYHEGLKTVETRLPGEILLLAEYRRQCAAADPFAPDALKYARQALSLANSCLPACHPDTAEYYNVMGFVLKMKKSPRKALPFYWCALNISEKDANRPATVGEYRNNVGTLYEALGDYAQAEKYLTEACDIFQHAYRMEHPNLAIALNSLGRVLVCQGKCEAALEHHRSAKRIYEKIYDHENKSIAMSMYYIGKTLKNLNRLAEARSIGQEALEIVEHRYGIDDSVARDITKWLQTFP